MHGPTRSFALLVGLATLSACGDDGRVRDGAAVDDRPRADSGPGAPTDGGSQAMGDGAMGDGATPPPPPTDAGTPPVGSSTTAPPEAIERLAGSFAIETTFATISMVPFLGDQENLARSWGLAEITQEGETLVMSERGCRVVSEGSSATIPDAVPQSIEPRVATLEFATEGSVTRWVRPDLATPIGWTPASPSDALPETADDPRVIDQDGDGQPGVTVNVSGIASGDVYVVQWQRGWYEGELGDGTEVSGANHAAGSEQRTIGASSTLLEMDVPQRPAPDTSMNRVRLIPIDAGYDCARLLAEADALF